MLHLNSHPDYQTALDGRDTDLLDASAVQRALAFLSIRPDNHPTPLHFLPKLANELGVGSLALKDEGLRFGIGSFKALGGAYAIVRLALEKASTKMGRELSFEDLDDPDVRAVSSKMTFACATDGNHGRSVAQSAKFVGARSVIFVHGGVCVAALLLLISRRSGRSADRTIR